MCRTPHGSPVRRQHGAGPLRGAERQAEPAEDGAGHLRAEPALRRL